MALSDVLRDPNKKLDYVLYVEGKTLSTGATTGFYFSVCGRRDNATTVNPSGVHMRPLLVDPGSISRALSSDSQFSGLSQYSIQSVSLLNDSSSPYNLYWMLDYVWERQVIKLYAGERNAVWSTFELLWSSTVLREPRVEPGRVTIDIADPTESLNKSHPTLTTFVGIETCADSIELNTSGATPFETGYVSRFARNNYTMAFRFRWKKPAAGSRVFKPFQIIMNGGTGTPVVGFSITRTSTATVSWNGHIASEPTVQATLAQATYVEEGLWQTWIFSIKKNGAYYFYIDEAGTTGTSTPIIYPTANCKVQICAGDAGARAGSEVAEVMDVRLYSGFIPWETMRAVMSDVASAVTDPLLGSWRMDDGAGGGTNKTATDYASNNDAISVTTDSPNDFWVGSGEGDETLRGKIKPMAIGEPRQVEVPMLSNTWKQYHLPNQQVAGPSLTQANVDVFERGVAIFDETDPEVDANRGILTFTGSLPLDPVTADPTYVSLGGSAASLSVANLISRILTESGESSANGAVELDSIIGDMESGIAVLENKTSAELLSDVTTGVGAFLARDNDGTMRMNFLRPSLSPSYFGKPVLDFKGGNALTFTGTGDNDYSGNLTIAAWINSQALITVPVAGSSPLRIPHRICYIEETATSDVFQWGIYGKKMIVEIFHSGSFNVQYWEAELNDLGEDEHCLVAFSLSGTTGTFYQGRTPAEFAPLTTIDSFTSGSRGIAGATTETQIGQKFPGAIYHFASWAEVKTEETLREQMFWTSDKHIALLNAQLYIPLEEGSGTTVASYDADEINATATIGTQAWDPTFKIHLKKADIEVPTDAGLVPSSVTRVFFDRNWRPMGPSEINQASVTQNEYTRAQRPYRQQAAIVRRDARVVREFGSPVQRGYQNQVYRLCRLLDGRFRSKAVASTSAHYRPLLAAKEGDTLWLQGPVPGYNAIRSFRIIAADQDFSSGRVGLSCWGPAATNSEGRIYRRTVAEDVSLAAIEGECLVDADGNELVDASGVCLEVNTLSEFSM